MKKLNVLLFLMFTGIFAIANNEKNKEAEETTKKVFIGIVVDAQTGEELSGVRINIQGSEDIFYTDFEGGFEMEFIPTNENKITVSMISYEDKELAISEITEGNTLRIPLSPR